ncbi:AbrB family transcriptional regulator [Bartonella sp. HY329]|uniref:AbrB family transcriptional regulator n=1 Tax=unclassified Bartonella TaxID=2645622 RepID=UPI0021C94EC2|nr:MULTISPECIES: AbrB family transcriptional regulator [unclassified Bartonella]UXM93930.1 AbrB family transcriptional regulator [Bartonella sp. HY329]UXN08251.1 AbrB family transcriptional regulator [Bartonella sp. HY328]
MSWNKLKWPDLVNLPKPLKWLCLFAFTAIAIIGLELAHIPAALLLGPMISAIILAVSNVETKIPKLFFTLAQGIVGCMIARAIKPEIVLEVWHDLPLFLSGVFAVIFASTLIGLFLTKRQILPGTTAIWGSAPGGSSTMVIMAEAYGADERLVAVMQYMRVVIVAALGSILARFVSPSGNTAFEIDFFPTVSWEAFAITLLIAFGGSLGAKYSRIPAGGMLVPFLIAVFLQDFGFITLELPPWILATSYIIIGWTVGLRFTRTILMHALHAIPVLFISIVALIVLCGGFALALSYFANVDLLTSYLATSPGGADSISIIAASTNVNLPFVMAYQSVRFIIVTITGPIIARFSAKYILGKITN